MIEKAGTHQLWRGGLTDEGRPLFVAHPARHLAHRPAWCNYWGVPFPQIHRRRFTRVCSHPLCVQPTHFILSGPESVYKSLGWPKGTRAACRRAFAAEGQRGGLGGKWWDTSRIEDEEGEFGPPVMVVQALAERFRWPRLAVLAAWSERVKQDIKERR